MSEEPAVDDLPPIPRPFQGPDPASQLAPAGCGTPVLVGCGLATLLLAVGVVLVLLNAHRLVTWAFDRSHAALVQSLPEDLDPALRSRFDRAWTATVEEVRREKLTSTELARLQGAVQKAVTQAGRRQMSEDVLEELTVTLEEISGLAQPSSEPEPLESGQLTPPRSESPRAQLIPSTPGRV